MTPNQSGFFSISGVSPTLPSLSAIRDNATEKCVNRLFVLELAKWALESNISSGTSEALWHRKCLASNRVTLASELFPSTQDSKNDLAVTPHPLMTPRPVTTTRGFSANIIKQVDAPRFALFLLKLKPTAASMLPIVKINAMEETFMIFFLHSKHHQTGGCTTVRITSAESKVDGSINAAHSLTYKMKRVKKTIEAKAKHNLQKNLFKEVCTHAE
eukprot:CAMPEP_0194443516 /NCGR_PEP_ID=MMETSP0176-20130528/126752_1 /TAXON_ID=216777 /ORGANISM="Proboscia alata, Strain PI-D3" /LENGTH=214 /DNA_ID=CAMNT_0039269781 /DNA_START=470 /DNA_END=1114 /DNA_ORIENTATION=+